MSAVEECYELTKALFEILQIQPEEERDDYISNVETLLNRRESVLGGVLPPFTEQEMVLGQQILKWNQVIDLKMTAFRDDIKREMNGAVKKKASVKKYSNPYDIQTDGYYYDKKN